MPSTTTAIDGLLLIDKPTGMTSHDVVDGARRALGISRVGHAGTLDPFATGLLVLLVGRATRLLPYLEGEPKVYDATMQFGVETATDDATGHPTRGAPLPAAADVAGAIRRLTGTFEQIPPAYSAKKISGRRAYAAARRGQSIDLKPARVTVHSWTVVSQLGGSLRVIVECSGGTYVRALARDLGRATKSAAHLAALRRLRSGSFSLDDAQTLPALCAGEAHIHSLRAAIPSMPLQHVDEDQVRRLTRGQTVAAAGDAIRVALLDGEAALVAIGERVNDVIRPVLVLRDA